MTGETVVVVVVDVRKRVGRMEEEKACWHSLDELQRTKERTLEKKQKNHDDN